MLKKLLSFFLLLAIACSCNVGKKARSGKDLLFELQFKGHFDADTVSLTINGCPVVENKVLVNDKRESPTNLHLEASLYKGDRFRIFYNGAVIECLDTSSKIAVGILFNNTAINYSMELADGKYIGFSKVSTSELSFRQSAQPLF